MITVVPCTGCTIRWPRASTKQNGQNCDSVTRHLLTEGTTVARRRGIIEYLLWLLTQHSMLGGLFTHITFIGLLFKYLFYVWQSYFLESIQGQDMSWEHFSSHPSTIRRQFFLYWLARALWVRNPLLKPFDQGVNLCLFICTPFKMTYTHRNHSC